MIEIVRRGDMYFADLDPVVGSEQGGYRPVLIIQNDIGNFYSPTVIVAALSGKVATKAKIPTHYIVQAYVGLNEKSMILLEQIRTIDKRRLYNYIGRLNKKDMEQIDKCLAVSLALKVM
jgi:mRNA interferase MazF